MFFLLRLMFWIGLVLVLLPREPATAPNAAAQLDAAQAISAATAAVSDMAQFCTRQPAACEAGGHAAALIGERAQGGARQVYRFLIEQNDKDGKADRRGKDDKSDAGDHTGSIGDPADAAGHDTLTAEDRRIPRRLPAEAGVDQG